MKKLVYILLIAACWACTDTHKTEKYQYKRDNVIQVKDKIKEIKIDSLILSTYCDLHIIDEYLLIADYVTYDHHINIFNKNTFQYITSIAYPGQEPGEIEHLGSTGIDNAHRKFNIADDGKKVMFSYNLDSALANPSSYLPEEKIEIRPNKILRQYQYINDILCMGIILEPVGSSACKMSVGTQNMDNGEFSLMPFV